MYVNEGATGKRGVSAQGEGPTFVTRWDPLGRAVWVKALVYVLGSVDGACVGAGEVNPL